MQRHGHEADGSRRPSESAVFETRSAERHHALFDGSADAIIGTDLRGVIISWSPGAHRLFGYRSDEMIGSQIARLVPTEQRRAESSIMERIASGSSVAHFDTERVRKDGSLVAVSRNILPILDIRGNVIGAYDVSHDLSQFRELERALRESEVRFHEIFDNMLEGCQIQDRSGRFVYVNDSLARQCRVPRDRLIGRTMTEVFPAFADGETFAAFERCMHQREPARCEVRYEYPDGSHGWFDLSIQPASDGLFCLSVDITERKDAEEQIAASERRFHQITDSLPLLVWTATLDGVCDYLSRRWEEYTGIASDQAVAEGWLSFVHPDDRESTQLAWQEAVAEGKAFRAECRLRRHDQAYRWFDCRGTPLQEERGVVPRWFGTSADIDDVRRAQLIELHNHKLESLGTLASGIAHDFNDTLFAILGNTELALLALDPGHRVQALLGEIQRASLRARDLVRRILAFSRRDEPKRQAMALAPIIDEAVEFLRPTLPANITVGSGVVGPIPAVLADSTQMHQLIMNLVANAAHAIGQQAGTIELKLDVVRADRGRSTTTRQLRKGTYVRLTVRDDGCGMDERTVAQIFDPFFTTKTVGEGTGLGLSMVATIMNTPERAIDVRSTPGHGTTFELYFPSLDDLAVIEREPALDRPLPTGRSKRVLYVDDDKMLVDMETELLKQLGYVAVGCTDPVEALERFKSGQSEFDAVVTDLLMPNMSGIELARELLLLRPNLPVILVSGRLEPNDVLQARLLGIGAVLSKPFTVAALDRALGEQLDPSTHSATLAIGRA